MEKGRWDGISDKIRPLAVPSSLSQSALFEPEQQEDLTVSHQVLVKTIHEGRGLQCLTSECFLNDCVNVYKQQRRQ